MIIFVANRMHRMIFSVTYYCYNYFQRNHPILIHVLYSIVSLCIVFRCIILYVDAIWFYEHNIEINAYFVLTVYWSYPDRSLWHYALLNVLR